MIAHQVQVLKVLENWHEKQYISNNAKESLMGISIFLATANTFLIFLSQQRFDWTGSFIRDFSADHDDRTHKFYSIKYYFPDQNACLLSYNVMELGLVKILLYKCDRANKFCPIICVFAR